VLLEFEVTIPPSIPHEDSLPFCRVRVALVNFARPSFFYARFSCSDLLRNRQKLEHLSWSMVSQNDDTILMASLRLVLIQEARRHTLDKTMTRDTIGLIAHHYYLAGSVSPTQSGGRLLAILAEIESMMYDGQRIVVFMRN
jgi:hypothetical protein